MKKNWIRIVSVAVVACMISTYTGCQSHHTAESADLLSSWTEGSKAKQSLEDYVGKVTTEGSDQYVPVENRTAAFDLDGTLLCEKPQNLQVESALYRIDADLADQPEAIAAKETFLKGQGKDYLAEDAMVGIAFEGMTPEEYTNYITDFMKTQKEEGFEDLSYVQAFYKPMMEVIEYLKQHQFTIYLLSGSDQGILWSIEDEVLHMVRSQAIGGNYELKGQNQGDASDTDYVLSPSEDVVRGRQYLYDDVGLNKVTNFYRQVGKGPLMMFGNSQGDFSALNYAISNPKYIGYAMIVDHNDAVREYDYQNTCDVKGAADQYGWQYVSMKDDFKTVFLKEDAKRVLSE